MADDLNVKRFDKIDADIVELKSDVAVLKSDVSILKTDVAVLKTDVAVLKTDVAVLKTDVAVLKSDVSEIKEKVNNLIDNLTSWKSELFNNIDGLMSEIRDNREYREIGGHQISSNTRRIEGLEKKVFGAIVSD